MNVGSMSHQKICDISFVGEMKRSVPILELKYFRVEVPKMVVYLVPSEDIRSILEQDLRRHLADLMSCGLKQSPLPLRSSSVIGMTTAVSPSSGSSPRRVSWPETGRLAPLGRLPHRSPNRGDTAAAPDSRRSLPHGDDPLAKTTTASSPPSYSLPPLCGSPPNSLPIGRGVKLTGE